MIVARKIHRLAPIGRKIHLGGERTHSWEDGLRIRFDCDLRVGMDEKQAHCGPTPEIFVNRAGTRIHYMDVPAMGEAFLSLRARGGEVFKDAEYTRARVLPRLKEMARRLEELK